MPSLHEMQRALGAAIFDDRDGGNAVESLIRANGIPVLERVEIYRNNLREGFRKALALEFPVIERLVGAQYFRQLAREFLDAHPSGSGDLHHVGAPFEGFLRARFTGSEYAYFADVAALEWAHCEVLVAADAASGLEALAAVPADDYADLCFSLAPACRLVRSAYPLLRIWQANQPEATAEETIDLGSGGICLLVRRGATDVEFHTLEAASYEFAATLASGQTLAAAFDVASDRDPGFDVGATLQRLVGLGVLVAPQVKRAVSGESPSSN